MNNVTKLAALILLNLILSSVSIADTRTDTIAAAVNNPARSDKDRQRDKTSKPVEVLYFFGVSPGMKVLDLLSGGGYYSEILSYALGDQGQVVAHTNKAYDQYVAEAVKTRFGNDRLPRVKRLISEVPAMALGENAFDMILMVMVYHDIYYVADYWPPVDRENYFSQIHAALKPGGTLAIIDHSAKAGTGNSDAQTLHRIDEAFARKDIENAGFRFVAASDVLRNADDDRTIQVFDEAIRGKTDRFVYRFVKK